MDCAFDKYAIIETGGKQYQALEGKPIAVDKIDGEPGDEVVFDKVLLQKLGENQVNIGAPYTGTKVTASIIKQKRGPKVIIFKFKRRKKSRVKKGFRAEMTVIRINAIA